MILKLKYSNVNFSKAQGDNVLVRGILILEMLFNANKTYEVKKKKVSNRERRENRKIWGQIEITVHTAIPTREIGQVALLHEQ